VPALTPHCQPVTVVGGAGGDRTKWVPVESQEGEAGQLEALPSGSQRPPTPCMQLLLGEQSRCLTGPEMDLPKPLLPGFQRLLPQTSTGSATLESNP
jgi:hypothetical protein